MYLNYDDWKRKSRIWNEIVLERFYHHAKLILNKDDINNFPDVFIHTVDNVVIELLHIVWGKRQENEITLKTPKTWFNWLKTKYYKCKWMKWIIQRYPIKYNYHKFEITKYTTFPELDVPIGKDKVVYYTYKENEQEKT